MLKNSYQKLPLSDRRWFIRLLEIVPGAATWVCLLSPFLISLIYPVAVAYFIISFDLYWLIKSFRYSLHLLLGYRRLHRMQQVDWHHRLELLGDVNQTLEAITQQIAVIKSGHRLAGSRLLAITKSRRSTRRKLLELMEWYEDLEGLADHQAVILPPKDIYHAVILATYNEEMEVLEPSVKALVDASWPKDRLMLVIAYEERGGEATHLHANQLIERYGKEFAYAVAVKHPAGMAGEIPGKGANISYAARQFTEQIESMGISPEQVIITTFDADNKADKTYFPYLAYIYAINPNRVHTSYQPIPMFFNNIWDAPAPMRVIATGTSFWTLMEMMRPHRLRTFSAHAQSLRTLIDTDYWSVTSIVEDGHQYWRTYFAYNGDHIVLPVFAPVYQDAVLAAGYFKTLREQYLQLRRWAWGISDFPYVVRQSMINHNIGWGNKLVQIWRLFESHFSWATSSLLLSFTAWLPLILNQSFRGQLLAYQLPVITGRIMGVATLGVIVTVYISMISLPPRPGRYKRSKSIGMVFQWVLLPLVAIFYSAIAAVDSQTRLMLGKYLDFRVTEKAVKK